VATNRSRTEIAEDLVMWFGTALHGEEVEGCVEREMVTCTQRTRFEPSVRKNILSGQFVGIAICPDLSDLPAVSNFLVETMH
jgi:hypothetical protein